jgi:serralysin
MVTSIYGPAPLIGASMFEPRPAADRAGVAAASLEFTPATAASWDSPVENGAGTPTTAVEPTGDARIDGILLDQRWAAAISYSDPDAADDYAQPYFIDSNENGVSAQHEGFGQISADQLSAVHGVLNAEASFYGVNRGLAGFSIEGFTNASVYYAVSGSGASTIRLGNTEDVSTARVADFPNLAATGNPNHGGDVWFGGAGRNPVVGSYHYHAVLHELGHAFGLKHGHDADTSYGGFGAVPAAFDSLEYTVMTYRTFIGDELTGYKYELWGAPQSFMMLDIAALQHMYGADFTSNGGDTSYSWDPLSGSSFVNGRLAIAPGGNRIFQTIWDGDGTDTYDLSNYATNLVVDLTPGGHSTFSDAQRAFLGGGPNGGYARGNVFNALQFDADPRSLIENATGGWGNDAITGNTARNGLRGGGGNDRLHGGGGNDGLAGGAGADTLSGDAGADRLEGGAGKDVLIGGGNAADGTIRGDIFDFNQVSDSPLGANWDVLRAGGGGGAFDLPGAGNGDRIDLSGLGVGWSDITLQDRGASTHCLIDVSGSAAADMRIQINDGGGLASTYSSADFLF